MAILSYKKTLLLFLLLPVFSAVLRAGQSTIPPIADAVADTKCVIVIDAGHGGGEWGVSVRGIYEKNINLELAKKIKEKIENTDSNIAVLLTRGNDDYVKVEDRAGFANSKKACIYISLHCDYSFSNGVEGYKVYYMQGNGAVKDESSGMVKWNEVQQRHAGESKRLATYILQYMRAALIAESGGSDDNDLVAAPARGESGIKGFALMNLDMPAVLFEVGNLNNNNDFAGLKDARVLNQMAYHIKEGIMNYMKEARFNGGGNQE